MQIGTCQVVGLQHCKKLSFGCCCEQGRLWLQDSAEFGRIGKYYATESMLVYDPERQEYDADATPSYGKDTLEEFFRRAIKEDGMVGQDLGDAAVF